MSENSVENIKEQSKKFENDDDNEENFNEND